MPGTGKNYVSDHIAKHLYTHGTNSSFVRKFMGRIEFPMESDVNYYRVSWWDFLHLSSVNTREVIGDHSRENETYCARGSTCTFSVISRILHVILYVWEWQGFLDRGDFPFSFFISFFSFRQFQRVVKTVFWEGKNLKYCGFVGGLSLYSTVQLPAINGNIWSNSNGSAGLQQVGSAKLTFGCDQGLILGNDVHWIFVAVVLSTTKKKWNPSVSHCLVSITEVDLAHPGHLLPHICHYSSSEKKSFLEIDSLESSRWFQITLRATIVNAIKKCPRSLFIFDEVDKIPSGLFESLTSLLDHHDNVDGVNLRHATFIFLSNAGGTEISEKLLQLTENGMLREETQLFHFEKITEVAAYNIVGMEFLQRFLPAIFFTILTKLPLIGGLRKASLIESSLIDHFIPFLPLEKRHIEKCIISDFKRQGIDRPTFADIEYGFVYCTQILSINGHKFF